MLTFHHRKPKSLGGMRTPENLILLPDKKHDAWHLLFVNYPPEQIAAEINAKYIDPEYEIIVRKKNAETE
jgi:cbb3-type cytochrome oxidase cytochrome c subunit